MEVWTQRVWHTQGDLQGPSTRIPQSTTRTQHEGDGDEAGVLVAVNNNLLEVALLAVGQHQAASETRGVVTGQAPCAPKPRNPAAPQPPVLTGRLR